MNEIATTAYDRWKHEYSYSSPMKDAAYHGFVFGSPSPRSSRTFDKWVLPLTGPALQHAAFRRQAEFATDILLGKVPVIETLLALDTVNAEIEQEDDRQEAIVRAVIDEAVAQYVPAEWDAELVRLMESMDWTFDYADRPNSAWSRQAIAMPACEIRAHDVVLTERDVDLYEYPPPTRAPVTVVIVERSTQEPSSRPLDMRMAWQRRRRGDDLARQHLAAHVLGQGQKVGVGG